MSAPTAHQAAGAVECPLCRGTFEAFAPTARREEAVCPGCQSRERHRALWLMLEERLDLLENADSLLHFAPEECLADRLAAVARLRYITADLDAWRADLPLDLMDLKLPDEAFGAILCSHVLEHVPDDRRAMAELHRILKPGGWLVVMVPLDVSRAETYEDASITDPQERLAAFRQEDHVRLYAPDIADRLSAAGFEVEEIPVAEQVGPDGARRYGLLPSDHVFLCHR
ncbi:MAG: methyltransferase domain-containing protein [Actinomycetota bacterium]|nr:methyltransferase domain-containing protein [Actinomycetota bacterium]MDQ3720407.1 methyltransferase domain-containing protein [Actinomycetota bacterium]